MSAWLRKLFRRPMERVCFCFVDIVSGQPIYLWRDPLGVYWMAETRWGWFRVEHTHGPEIWVIP